MKERQAVLEVERREGEVLQERAEEVEAEREILQQRVVQQQV